MQYHPYISHNGTIKHASEVSFPWSDIGYLNGFGLFETLLIHHSLPFHLEDHFDRMRASLERLSMPFNVTLSDLRAQISVLVEKNGIIDACLNIYVTPGPFTPLESAIDAPDTQLVMVARPLTEKQKQSQVRLGLLQEDVPRSEQFRLKTMSYFHSYDVKRRHPDCDEVMLCDPQGDVLEATFASVFFIKGTTVLTANATRIIPSITKSLIMELAKKEGYAVQETTISNQTFNQFDEIFLASSLRGVIAVTDFAYFPSLISKEKTQILSERFQRYLHSYQLSPVFH